MSIGHHQYPQSQGHLQQQQQGNAPPPPTAQPQPFSSLHAPALYGLHDYPTNLNASGNAYYTSASAPSSAGYSNFPPFESAGNSPVATTFQHYGSGDQSGRLQGQGQGMFDIYGNPQNPGRRVYGGIAPRQRGDSVSTTITNGNISTPYAANGNGHGNGYGGGGYGGEESVPSSPLTMTSGMMSQYYGYGGGESYYPQNVGGNGYRGRGKPVHASLLS